MKLRLSILLLAAALAAAPASGQTIKSLGYNTTNGNVVAATNVTFTNSVGFATNARAATRTNLGGTTVGNSVFTATNAAAARTAISAAAADGFGVASNAYRAGTLVDITDGFLGGADALSYADGVWAVSNPTNFRTAIGLGATNAVTFSNITASGNIYAKDSTGGAATNSTLARGIQWTNLGGSGIAAIYGSYPGTPQIYLAVGATNALTDVATFRSTGMTVASNAVVGGTLAVTGNVTMSGVGNTAPSQTASSGSSLMTRDLVETAQLRTFNKYATYEVFNFTTNMLTAIGGSASPINYTGTSTALPSWAYTPAAVDGATNHQALRHQYGALSKGNRSYKNWSKRNVFALRIQDMTIGAGTVRIYYGPVASTWAGGSLAVKGLGFELVGNSLSAVVHNGTTNTTSSAVTTATYHAYNLLMESDGAGGVRWWVNGVEQTALTGGPTGNGGEDSHGIVTEVINPTPYVADTLVWIEALQLISEL